MFNERFIEIEIGEFNWCLSTHTDSCIDASILKKGVWEYSTTNLVKGMIKNGDVVLDIGANIGYFTMIFSKLVGSNGLVVAFEPHPEFYKRLLWHVEKNNLINVKCIKKGLFNNKGKGILRRGHPSAVLVDTLDEKEPFRCADVDLITLDDWLVDNPLNKIDYIKIDVDGPEPEIIYAAKNLIKRYCPVFISEFYVRAVELGEMFWSFGYKIYDEVTGEEIEIDTLEKVANSGLSCNFLVKKGAI